jgi:hypothetical protein
MKTGDAGKPEKARVVLSIPLSPAQKAELERRAGARPLSVYAREALFPANDNAPKEIRAARHGSPVKDRQALAAVLARLGQSDAASSLRELARAIRLGAMPITPETESAIQRACADLENTKGLIMKALGLRQR